MSRINLIALTREQMVELLMKVGSATFNRVALDADLASGAPLNSDGTINLIHYAAWLIRELQE